MHFGLFKQSSCIAISIQNYPPTLSKYPHNLFEIPLTTRNSYLISHHKAFQVFLLVNIVFSNLRLAKREQLWQIFSA